MFFLDPSCPVSSFTALGVDAVVNDVLVGAPNDNSARGAVYAISLQTSGALTSAAKIASGLGGLGTLAAGDSFGFGSMCAEEDASGRGKGGRAGGGVSVCVCVIVSLRAQFRPSRT